MPETARQPETKIGMVHVEVPVDLPPSKSKYSEDPHVTLEIYGDGCLVWDAATYTDCSTHYPFTDKRAFLGHTRDQLPDMPYFDQVYRHLVDQCTANRSNPLGQFLTVAVNAMDQALCERNGTRVYFARASSRIKIGWSRNVAARIGKLQTGNPDPVRLLATTPGGRALERHLHERFARHWVAGEWFEAAPELLTYIATLTAQDGRAKEEAREVARV